MDDPTTVLDAVRAAALMAPSPDEPSQAETPEVTALVDRAKVGEAEAFDGLMLLFERRIISLGIQMGLSREDSLDACQETFLKVFRYIGKFRSGEAFFKWLYRIAVNCVYDQLRRSKGPGGISVEQLQAGVAASLRDTTQTPQDSTLAADLRKRLLGSLHLLTRQERIVFVLRDLQQVPTERIGKILGLSQITVRRHCMLARQKLRDRLFSRER